MGTFKVVPIQSVMKEKINRNATGLDSLNNDKTRHLLLAGGTSTISSVLSSTSLTALSISSLDETRKNIDQTQATSINLTTKLQVEFDKVYIHPLFKEEEQKVMKERFDCSNRLLANLVSSDHRCVRISSNIVDGIYGRMNEKFSIVQTVEILLTRIMIRKKRGVLPNQVFI